MHLFPIGLRLALLFLIVLGIGAVIWTALQVYRAVRSKSQTDAPSPAELAAAPPAETTERRIILEMVRSGKITEDEGAALLDAVERKVAERHAMSRTGDAGLIVGTLLCVFGFVLPWNYVRDVMGMSTSAYQAGYHVGAIGWLILLTGSVPALIACIPAASKAIDVLLLRVIVAGAGGALTGGLLVCVFSQRGDPGIGLFAVLAGSIVLLVSGLRARRAERDRAKT